jgi:LysM repeat protein
MAQTRAHSLCTAAASGVLAVVGVVVLSAGPAFAADHTVQPGENLVGIARQHGVTVADLVRINGLADPNHVVAGTTLQLPGRTTKPATRTTATSARPARPATPTRGSATKAATALAGKGPAYTLSEDLRRQVNQLLDHAAREFGVKPSLLKALTYTESRWHQDAVSSVGAIGVGQLLPGTASWLAGLMGEPGLDVRSTQDNVRLSAKLLRLLLDRTGSTKQALAAYYQGIGAVLQRGVSTGGARYAAIITARQTWFS